ncbi:hypothetical protein [Sphingomonas hankookensis]|uniref:hypothetical protein n=1 Tax=Sphingomonas hankookensis TaxID=563996 RepID=UPI003D302DE4
MQVAGDPRTYSFAEDGYPLFSSEVAMGGGRFTIVNAPETADIPSALRKMVVGLRQLVSDMVGQSEARMEDTSVEAKGFLSEAMDQYADRVAGYATELAQSIGYVEASPDLLAARELASNIVGRLVTRDIQLGRASSIRLDRGATARSMTATEAVQAILEGHEDDTVIVKDMLVAIERGRTLAANDFRAERIAEMLRPPAREGYRAPARLTVTLEGPQASGKTRVAQWIIAKVGGYIGGVDPQVIEVGGDGRRFDVRNEEYLDHA